MSPLIPEYILDIPPYPLGKPWQGDEVRLSANENPLGPPPRALEEIKRCLGRIHRYPDGAIGELKGALAQHLGLREGNIVLGNGSNEVIEMVVKVFLREGDEAIIPTPSFAYYRIAVRARGGRVVEVPLRDFRVDLEAIARAVTERTRLVFIDNPNNPTGTIFTKGEFETFLGRIPEGVVTVVDEAYGEFVSSPEYPTFRDHLRQGRTIVALRTFSKFYGLAGLRVGYGVAREEIIEVLDRVHQPFNVSILGVAGCLGALRDEDFQRRTRQVIEEGRRFLTEGFKRLGVEFVPSEANFLLVKVGRRKERLVRLLKGARVVVRDMKGYGLPEYVRVTVGLPEENRQLLEVFEACVR